jgi:hypothetical protein
MKQQAPHPDTYIFPVSFAGDELAALAHASHEAAGRTVVDTHEVQTGYLIRVIKVYGKRKDEGQIAKYMKQHDKPQGYGGVLRAAWQDWPTITKGRKKVNKKQQERTAKYLEQHIASLEEDRKCYALAWLLATDENPTTLTFRETERLLNKPLGDGE